MASTSGIRANGSDRGEFTRKPILKDAAGYSAWSTKMETILDADDCWDIVMGTELEPNDLAVVVDEGQEGEPSAVADVAKEAIRTLEIKDWKRRFKKAASVITQSVDDGLVHILKVHNKNPILMWAALAADFNTITPAQLSLARRDFLNYTIPEDEDYLVSKQNFEDLLRLVTSQNGVVSDEDKLQTLLGSLPERFDTIRESYFAQTPAPGIDYIWRRMFDRETTQKRREQSAVMRGEVYFQSRGRGGFVRGRGRGAARGGGSGSGSGGRGGDVKSENCFRCGESDHWSRECPKKDSICTWCGAAGHIEKTCYSKANGAARGGKIDGVRGRGRSSRGRGGYSRYGEGDTKEDVNEQGFSEVLVGEVHMGTGDGDGEEREWVCDSGADFHMTGDITLFESIENIPSVFYVKQVQGKVQVTQWGVVLLCTDGADGEKLELQLRQVLYVPGMKVNIFSLQRIRCKGACSYTFKGAPSPQDVIPIFNRDGKQIATMRETTKARPTLICTRMEECEYEMEGEALGAKGVQMDLLHRRLGHTSQSVIERLVREQLVRGLEEGVTGEMGMCRGCKMGRSSEKPHPRKDQQYRAKEQLELVHVDIAGPFSPKSVDKKGYQYNLVVVDDFSRKSWCIPLKKKSDTKVALKEWIVVAENQTGKRLKKLRSDNGGEFIDGSLETWLTEHGILHQKIPARSPQSNGISERMNRTVQDRARSMLVSAGLGGGFWVESLQAASYIRNRGPVAGLSMTPDELWSGIKPTVKHLRAYGSKAYVSLEKPKRKGKMGVTKWEGVIVGYPIDSVGYRVWDPVRGKIFNVGVPHVDESVQPGWWKKGAAGGGDSADIEVIVFPDLDVDEVEGAAAQVQVQGEVAELEIPDLVEDSSDDEEDDVDGEGDEEWGPDDDAPGDQGGEGGDDDEPAAVDESTVEEVPVQEGPRHSDRERRGVPPARFIEMYLAAAADDEARHNPETVREALDSSHREKWQAAMNSEMESLRENGVYEIVDRPWGKKVVKSKWVLRVKTNEKGEVEKFKARVVAKGFSQVEGVDFDQTFSPTVRFEGIRQMVALGTSRGMKMHQMDVTTAFLYAPLEEEVYMEQPEGTIKVGDEGKVMRLLKCLYGLKQSPRQWNILIDTVLKKLGFKRLLSDVGMYVKGEGVDAVYIALYVDDLLIVGMKLINIESVKKGLCAEFKMKDLGEAKFLLGIEIRRQENGDVLLVQEHYARDVIRRFNMEGCKPVSTPLEFGCRLDSSSVPTTAAGKVEMVDVPYRSAIGSLMYLATCTRPDISAAVSELSKFSQNPGVPHWEGVKRVLRYVSGTVGEGLLYKRGAQVEVMGYSDSGHAGEKETSRGRTGYVFLSAGAAISWRSSMMKVVTHSSCESEYVGLSESSNEAVYLQQLQEELGIGKPSVLLLGDNESSLKLAENPVFHQKSKHILIKYHSIRERVEEGKIELCKVDTGLNAADMMTKNVGVAVLKMCKGLVGMVSSG